MLRHVLLKVLLLGRPMFVLLARVGLCPSVVCPTTYFFVRFSNIDGSSVSCLTCASARECGPWGGGDSIYMQILLVRRLFKKVANCCLGYYSAAELRGRPEGKPIFDTS